MGGGWDWLRIVLGNEDYGSFVRFPLDFGLCPVMTIIGTMHNLSQIIKHLCRIRKIQLDATGIDVYSH